MQSNTQDKSYGSKTPNMNRKIPGVMNLPISFSKVRIVLTDASVQGGRSFIPVPITEASIWGTQTLGAVFRVLIYNSLIVNCLQKAPEIRIPEDVKAVRVFLFDEQNKEEKVQHLEPAIGDDCDALRIWDGCIDEICPEDQRERNGMLAPVIEVGIDGARYAAWCTGDGPATAKAALLNEIDSGGKLSRYELTMALRNQPKE